MFLYLRFFNPSKYSVQYIKHVPLFVLLKLKLADAERVEKSFISSILKGQRKEFIEEQSQKFLDKYYPGIIRQNALDFIKSIDKLEQIGMRKKTADCNINLDI